MRGGGRTDKGVRGFPLIWVIVIRDLKYILKL
jgi:hypothetical protein